MTTYSSLPIILLVEDNVDDYEATVRSFTEAHLYNPVQWCQSGNDALSYLRRTDKYADMAATALPSLILLDLNMPGIDGRKVLEQIKHDKNLKKIPVVILTTSADEKDVNQCYDVGASTYIQKPVDFEGLVKSICSINDYWFDVALLPRPTKTA